MSDKPYELPRIAAYKPQYWELEKDKSYLWCSCGLSRTQPFCDQSHRGTDFKPVRYIAKEDGQEVLFCTCKHSSDQPFCDGSHNNLRDVYDEDDPDSDENKKIPEVAAGENGLAMLDGGCYVAKVDKLARTSYGALTLATLISADTGAHHQSQFYGELGAGTSSIVSYPEREVIILVGEGFGSINISGREFELEPETGIYVRSGEAFSVTNSGEAVVKLYISVCPLAVEPSVLSVMPVNFDDDYGRRVVGIDTDNRQSMADRFFQMLVDKDIGSTVVTQFIGDVPLSKAALHRHLYEESLVILRGSGCMWTEKRKTLVKAGDVIFLPRKQIHSLQCTDPEGMMLAGIIYPGDNPSINY
ncbi:MAG: mannose-6-phosphate isomerase-like protein (cupin superfamily) [Halieaceae bacterium]|jgi:mannose-6-phosphate isomerase-like protein (cupin superfamily)